MRFLWKSQLKRERGKLLPKSTLGKNKATRKDRFESRTQRHGTYPLIIFLWLLFFGTAGYLVLFSSYLALGSWRVTGLTLVPEIAFQEAVNQELSHQYFGLIARNRFFLLQPKQLEHFLQERYPLIRSVSVRRTFPDTFEIIVEEREALVLWCVADTCAHILEDGSVVPTTDVYQKEENQSRTLMIRDDSGQPLKFGAGVFADGFVTSVVTLRKELGDRLGLATRKTLAFSSRFANELRVETEAGWWIYVNTRLPIETSLDALQLLLEEEIPQSRQASLDYIDLRTENRAFYRYQDGSGFEAPVPAAEAEVTVETQAVKEKKK